MLSKNPLMSRSTTHDCFQQLRFAFSTACEADLPERYPYEPFMNSGSSVGSSKPLTTVWAIRSAIVGMPRGLSPPPFFGISTSFTGDGMYEPELILFQTLYR